MLEDGHGLLIIQIVNILMCAENVIIMDNSEVVFLNNRCPFMREPFYIYVYSTNQLSYIFHKTVRFYPDKCPTIYVEVYSVYWDTLNISSCVLIRMITTIFIFVYCECLLRIDP